MRAMKDSGIEWIGEIPESWDTIKFKYLHNGMNTGEAIDKNYWTNNNCDTVFYTAGSEPIHTNFKDFPLEKYVEENDILLARNGTPYVYLPFVGSCYTDHIIRVKGKNNINKSFIKYSLQQSILSIVVDTVSIPTWSASLWNEQTIPYPSSKEQERIAEFLDKKCGEIDEVIAKTEKTIEEYKALKQSVITKAVTKGIRPNRPMKDSGIEWIGQIPEEWIKRKIKNIAQFYNGDRGINYPSGDDMVEEGIMFVTSNNIHNIELDVSNSKYITSERYNLLGGAKIKINDVIFCLRGSVGNCSINKTITEGTVASSLCTIRATKMIPDLLNYILHSEVIKTQTAVFMNGTCAANLSAENVSNYTVFVPNISEQKEIVNYLNIKCDEIDKLIESKQQLLTELEIYKKSVIYEYVTGKKEV